MRSANPTLSDKTFLDAARMLREAHSDPMTIDGTVNKSGLLLAALLLTAGFTWNRAFTGGAASVQGLMLVGVFGGLIFAIVTIFKKEWAPFTAPAYALLEGLALGGISARFEMMFPGIVIQAVSLTFATLFALLMAYKSGWIRATENFKLMVFSATGGIFVLYLVNFAMRMFGARVPFIHESGLLGIGFSLFVVAIASANLVLDFDFIENGAERGAPKFMEWYGAFGLMVTLVWLYLEILHLLAKLQSRRD
ncbi:MAG: hypothetical protein CO113_01845 [Elusimicrobia bacterium CG_4_9_14_3_um_filter_62_55]|nr:MAG: hypothetical protein COR54_10905 [Elusimicrobia bacterium CG22_combo_CG10-13_8_21_14_all_63_91]PJA18355.1 MAG: hypothetical protein COX66_01510 [Elusimicrobia bacterium CG_4_10_14_0_2_um_filter_63_34]PJB26781.1 MAG: hypothetical protein CO113_01845 [Elusimicrobia bacterium CG_4_9_14_3_um_filter_62_55]